MNKHLLAFIALASTSLSQLAAQDLKNENCNPEKNGYELLFKDEFNNSSVPNANDWLLRVNQKMGGASVKENVIQTKSSDGEGCLMVKFTYDSTKPKETQFMGGGVVSTHNFGYGYYEARVKLYGGKKELSGLHQSFWTMGLTGTNEGEGKGVRDKLVEADLLPKKNQVLEIDGFEQNSKDNVLSQNHHIYTPTHLSEAPKEKFVKQDLSQWIVMGYEWLPDKINFYCNGKLISTKDLTGKWKVYAPQNFWLTALPVSFKGWGGLSIPAEGVGMLVDYFHYYAKKLVATNLIGNDGFEYGGEKNTYPMAWITGMTNGSNPDAIKVVTDSVGAKEGNRYLEIKYNQPFKATAKQIIEFIPNGKYNLSAWIKSSGGQKMATLSCTSGTNTQLVNIETTDAWKKIEIKGIHVTDNKATVVLSCIGNSNNWLQIDKVEFSLK